MSNKNICFYMPSHTVGGCEYLFARIAKYLSDKFNIYYIDYPDGFTRSLLKDTSVKFIDYSDNCNEIKLINNCTVITPVTLAFKLPRFNADPVKILFWNLHPENINWFRIFNKLSCAQLGKFLKNLSQNGGLINYDIATYSTAKKYYKNIKKNYVSILMEKTDYQIREKLINANELNIAWLGRLDSDKIYTLINLLENLKNYKSSLNVNLHIIGDGDSKSKIDEKKYSKYFNIKFVGTIINDELKNYLNENIDILFGMGTSLLEAERLAIPSFLGFLSDCQFSNNEYVFTSDLEEYLVGCSLNFRTLNLKRQNLQNILDKFTSDIGSYSKAVINHFIKNFEISSNISSLLNALENCSYYQEELSCDLIKFKYKKKLKNYIEYKLNKNIKFFVKLQEFTGKPILFFVSSYSLLGSMKQRPEHLFDLFIKNGYIVACSDDKVLCPVEIQKNLYVFPAKYSDKLLRNTYIPKKLVMSISTHYTCKNLDKILIRAAKHKIPVIYEHLDDIELCPIKKIKTRLYKRLEKIAKTEEITISATADLLYEQAVKLRGSNKNIVMAKNGVNLEYFTDKVKDETFQNMIESKKPIIGYYGCILSEWFDFEILEYAIKNNPHLNFVIIGVHKAEEIKHLKQYSNFLCLDKMDFSELLKYSKHFTVATIPFKLNEITAGTSPVKMFEYMALGLPIVTTAMNECKKYQSCLIAHNKEEFSELINTAIPLKEDKEYIKILNKEANENKWENVYNKIIEKL